MPAMLFWLLQPGESLGGSTAAWKRWDPFDCVGQKYLYQQADHPGGESSELEMTAEAVTPQGTSKETRERVGKGDGKRRGIAINERAEVECF